MLLVHELHEARDRILLLIQRLEATREKEIPAYLPYLDEQINLLKGALEEAKIPDRYRVAVVGRFKVGKSSFVNKLADERLAGVDTNPETAAISIFRYDENAHAEVEIISKEKWLELEEGHKEDPKNPEYKRYDRFINFNDQRPTRKDKQGNLLTRENVDLKLLADRWLVKDGKTHTIPSSDWQTKLGKKNFLAEVKRFTSSQEPLHYLVNKLTIYAPIPLLRDQIELVDTPGLDDTERFRVVLTEELVKDVDAILFLTLSGASYSQTDKDFIVRQLRRRQIKHLQMIVTKCDETYENARRDAIENDDEPPTYEQFLVRERNRVKEETTKTLNELLQSNQLSDEEGYYFIEQLDNMPIQLISTKYHEEGEHQKGGIEAVRESLYKILSTSHRFEQSRTILKERLGLVLKRLEKSYSERLNTLEREFDPTKVRKEIESIRTVLGTRMNGFGERMGEAFALLEKEQEGLFSILALNLEVVGHQAKEVLNDLEKSDLVKHWQTRRHGYWGHLQDLQNKVADRVFPKVESVLNSLRSQLDTFMVQAEGHLKVLQNETLSLEGQYQLAGLAPLDLASSQAPAFQELRESFQQHVETERDAIVANLDQFITAEVMTRLDKARDAVANVRGTGTTARQGREVSAYYAEVRSLLSEALRSHLESRIKNFAQAIKKTAESVAPKLRQASDLLLVQRLEAIESSLNVASEGKKEQVRAYLNQMYHLLSNFAAEPQAVTEVPPRNPAIHLVATKSEEGAQAPVVSRRGELQEQHYEIPEGSTGYTYERIFCPYMENSETIEIEDAYIRYPHQLDNFGRFCALAVRVGGIHSILLRTGIQPGEVTDEVDSRLETLKRDLKSRGISFKWERDPKLHDRKVKFGNGWIVKIGRGLDIYNKPDSWTSVTALDFSLRPCRKTDVDVYRLFV